MQVVYIALVTPGGTVSADVRAVSYIGIPLAMIALNFVIIIIMNISFIIIDVDISGSMSKIYSTV